LSGPELEALRLAVHRRGDVMGRLDGPLFSHALARNTFELLRRTADVHEAAAVADPQAGDLLQRLAVEETGADPDDVIVRLVERAVQKELRELQAEMRQAPTEEQAAYAPTIAWLKLGLERMRSDDVTEHDAVMEAEQRLVAWLAERHAGMAP
jgi:hypothetical protein